ncbi:MAG: DVU_1553 family AMP-dependent CoA ligase [Anaerovoracaceae bacterium]
MYLDPFIKEKLGLSKDLPLTREAIDSYVKNKREGLIFYVYEQSPFHRKRLNPSLPWEDIPFTTTSDLKDNYSDMLCVPKSRIQRVVTIFTSGSQGEPKRVFFTEKDQENTMDYFNFGLRCMISKKDKVLILFPHEAEGSLGLLLEKAVTRLGAQPTFNPDEDGITSIIGPPSLLLGLMERKPYLRPESVLLSADYVSLHTVTSIKNIWGSKVFEHYGMTETGYGCAMSCRDSQIDPPVGYHLRENDIFIEIIHPQTKKILPDGQWGEIVMTTLTREGMPFLRYRTGDISRFIKEPCSCKSVLKRLDKVQEREAKKKTISL